MEISALFETVGQPIDTPPVCALIGQSPPNLVRSAFLGYLDYTNDGYTLVFTESRECKKPVDIERPSRLILTGGHFYREGQEGHREYRGRMPNDVRFGASSEQVDGAFGPPVAKGGGVNDPAVRYRINAWRRYIYKNTFCQYQFDVYDKMQMLSVFI